MQLLDGLIKETIATSKFETSRNYVSLSNIYKPIDELIRDYKEGYTANEDALFKCRLGYWMEKGLKERLMKIRGVEEGIEVVARGGYLIKGHPDFMYLENGFLLPCDCKSFAMDSYLPIDRVSNKIFWQMQAYMLYTNSPKSYVVCESRESGKINVITVRENKTIQSQIESKVREIYNILSH